MHYLHVEGHAHFVLKTAKIDFDHAIDEGLFENLLFFVLLELLKEAVIDDAREKRILKESHLVNELFFGAFFHIRMPTHGYILEDRLEVGLGNLVQEVRISAQIEVLDQDHLLRVRFPKLLSSLVSVLATGHL